MCDGLKLQCITTVTFLVLYLNLAVHGMATELYGSVGCPGG